MAIVTTATLPLTASSNFQLLPGSALHDVIVQYNNLMKQQAALALAFTSDGVLKASVPSIGTTVTLALSQGVITIAGVPVSVAAQTAQAFGALGTIPASTWGIIAIDRVAAGTTTFVSGAANYTTGYATEALAIAAVPAKTAAKARVGYVTVLASASTWVAGTDALAGGTGGNPATTTNYYAIASPWDIATDTANAITLGSIALTAKQIGVMGGAAISV
jgi:hypothetical protein